MHAAILIANAALIGAGLAVPVLLGLFGRWPLLRLVVSLMVVAGLTILYAWWRHASVDIELRALGVDLSGDNAQQRTAGLPEALKPYAEDLYWSPRKMGIRWQLQAIYGQVVALPYTVIAFAGARLLRHRHLSRR